MLINIPKRFCNVRSLEQHFKEAYPEDEIGEISISHDVSKLTKINFEREKAKRARRFCEEYVFTYLFQDMFVGQNLGTW